MNVTDIQPKGKRDRSPAYPAIPLGTAVDRLATFDEYFKRHPAPFTKVGLAWGIKPSSSQANSAIAALKSFGLVDYQGSGDDLKAVVSDDGRLYLRAQQDDIKRQVLRRCALKPKAILKYWTDWGAIRPPDPVCLDELVLKAKFSPAGAENFLRVYDATIGYAGLADSGSVDDENGSQEGNGADESEDEDGAADTGAGQKLDKKRRGAPLGASMRQDVFSIEEGAVTIEWPSALSDDSLKDIEDWLEIVKRKISRSVKKAVDDGTDEKPES